MSSDDPVGIVLTVHRGECEVMSGDSLRALRLVGRHAHREQELAVGDEVSFDPERGVVVDLLPRRTRLARLRSRSGGREHVIAANVDQLAIVASVADPPFRSGAIDRFALAAYAGGLVPLLVVNKTDLCGSDDLPEEIAAYRSSLAVIEVSAKTGRGIDELRRALHGARTVFAGHSGVGKSSLLNALDPQLELATAEVVAKTRKGRHTTTRSTWYRLDAESVAIDTPGIKEIATGPVDPEWLDRVFPEIAGRAGECRFRDCRHDREPGCAVREALADGEFAPGRLEQYRRLRREVAT